MGQLLLLPLLLCALLPLLVHAGKFPDCSQIHGFTNATREARVLGSGGGFRNWTVSLCLPVVCELCVKPTLRDPAWLVESSSDQADPCSGYHRFDSPPVEASVDFQAGTITRKYTTPLDEASALVVVYCDSPTIIFDPVVWDGAYHYNFTIHAPCTLTASPAAPLPPTPAPTACPRELQGVPRAFWSGNLNDSDTYYDWGIDLCKSTSALLPGARPGFLNFIDAESGATGTFDVLQSWDVRGLAGLLTYTNDLDIKAEVYIGLNANGLCKTLSDPRGPVTRTHDQNGKSVYSISLYCN